MPARAGRHDHSTQHLTDTGTYRVRAGCGDGYVAIGWDYPGSTLLEVRILRSLDGFAATADAGTADAARADAGQDVVYEDVTGSFRDRGLENGRDYFYTLFARDPRGGDWVRWGEHRLRPGPAQEAARSRSAAAVQRALRRVLPSLALALLAATVLAVAAVADDPSPSPGTKVGGVGEKAQAAVLQAVDAAVLADPAANAVLSGVTAEAQYFAWDQPEGGGAPTGVTVYYEWPAAEARSAAGVWPLVATGGDTQVPLPPYTQYERRLRMDDLTGLRVDVLLRGGEVLQVVPWEGAAPFSLTEQTWAPFSWFPWLTQRPWVLAPLFVAVGVVLAVRAWLRSRAWNRRLPSMTRHDRQFVGRLLVLLFLAVGLVWQVYEAWYAVTKPMVEAGGAQAGDLAALPVLLIAPGLFVAALVLELSAAPHRVAWALVAVLATAGSVFHLATAVTATTTNLNLTYFILLAVLALVAIPRAFSAGKMGWSRSFSPRYG